MPFRERVKKALGHSTHETSSDGGAKAHDAKQDDESAPKPKYRQPVDKQHKENLESFTFASHEHEHNDRRQSEYSPGGSKVPSRDTSPSGAVVDAHKHAPKGQTRIGHMVENANDDVEVGRATMVTENGAGQATSGQTEASQDLTKAYSQDANAGNRNVGGFDRERFAETDVKGTVEANLQAHVQPPNKRV